LLGNLGARGYGCWGIWLAGDLVARGLG
jgi:hypothetical protein